MAELPLHSPFILADIDVKIERSNKSKTELNTRREMERNKKERIYTPIAATPRT